ncbi:NAD-dependent epimerase/dehydratase family protein [candidate division CSSED10-310 bacterium]|uniref:NAD-dependent epimerase/dehydratase family protein n=1 Tax=candidate division CSSED10-310 bacterium TaxID=2855610 RepID=A0ABV6YU13_UNCC1
MLVTGASGFIGSHVAEYLFEQGEQVKILVRQDKRIGFQGEEKIEKKVGDLRFKDSVLNALHGVDTVYHLAAELRMGMVTKNELHQINAQGARTIIEACQEKKVQKLIFCSSVGVLGDTFDVVADETVSPSPDDDYERSKYEGEKAALDAASDDLEVVIVRPAWVYGPRDRRTLKLFKLINSGKMFMIGQGLNKLHPVFIGDLVRGIVATGRGAVPTGSIFHLAGPQIITVRELLNLAAQLLGKRIIPLHFPLSLARMIAAVLEPLFKKVGKEAPLTRGKLGFFIKNRMYSIEKAKKELAYNPEIYLEDGLRQTFNWYKKQNIL